MLYKILWHLPQVVFSQFRVPCELFANFSVGRLFRVSELAKICKHTRKANDPNICAWSQLFDPIIMLVLFTIIKENGQVSKIKPTAEVVFILKTLNYKLIIDKWIENKTFSSVSFSKIRAWCWPGFPCITTLFFAVCEVTHVIWRVGSRRRIFPQLILVMAIIFSRQIIQNLLITKTLANFLIAHNFMR